MSNASNSEDSSNKAEINIGKQRVLTILTTQKYSSCKECIVYLIVVCSSLIANFFLFQLSIVDEYSSTSRSHFYPALPEEI